MRISITIIYFRKLDLKQYDKDEPSEAKKEVLSPTTTDATVIFDMSDVCLVKLFKHLELIDLCAVAEVCT